MIWRRAAQDLTSHFSILSADVLGLSHPSHELWLAVNLWHCCVFGWLFIAEAPLLPSDNPTRPHLVLLDEGA